jgi:hypothetical protein
MWTTKLFRTAQAPNYRIMDADSLIELNCPGRACGRVGRNLLAHPTTKLVEISRGYPPMVGLVRQKSDLFAREKKRERVTYYLRSMRITPQSTYISLVHRESDRYPQPDQPDQPNDFAGFFGHPGGQNFDLK